MPAMMVIWGVRARKNAGSGEAIPWQVFSRRKPVSTLLEML
jgi:hypothetical protein